MNLSDLQLSFNRALSYTFSKMKLIFIFCILALCGVVVVFCRGLSLYAGDWIAMSLAFLPIFLCSGILLSAGIVLVRMYHDEVKNKQINLWNVIEKSFDIILGASYFVIPIILIYLVLWILLGFFILLSQLPFIGSFFSVVLSFAPFLLNFASLALCILTIAILFFVAPAIALNGLDRIRVSQMFLKRFKSDPFSNLLSFSCAIIPILLFVGLLIGSALLTGAFCSTTPDSLHNILQWFFMMIPFVALLSPSVVFFFNFAAESHVLQQNAKS